jgi:hypothetical protein
VHPIWLSDLLRAENDQVAGLLKQPDKQKSPRLKSESELLTGAANAIVKT